MPRFYNRYGKSYTAARRLRSSGIGTRYYSTRRYSGVYRSPSRYMFTGRARRTFGRNRLIAAIRATAERKYFDTGTLRGPGAGNGFIGDAGTFINLSGPAQGTLDTERVGDKCTGTSLQINLLSYVPPKGQITGSNAFQYYLLRVVIFIWRDDTFPTIAQVLQPKGGELPLSSGFPIEHLSHDYKVKRKILYDQTFTQYADDDNATYYGSMRPLIYKKLVIPLTKYGSLSKVNFVGGSQNGINNIYMLLKSNIPAASTNEVYAWNLEVNTRYNFIDV